MAGRTRVGDGGEPAGQRGHRALGQNQQLAGLRAGDRGGALGGGFRDEDLSGAGRSDQLRGLFDGPGGQEPLGRARFLDEDFPRRDPDPHLESHRECVITVGPELEQLDRDLDRPLHVVLVHLWDAEHRTEQLARNVERHRAVGIEHASHELRDAGGHAASSLGVQRPPAALAASSRHASAVMVLRPSRTAIAGSASSSVGSSRSASWRRIFSSRSTIGRPGFDPKLLGQDPAQAGEHLERVGLPPGSVQGGGGERVDAFVQRLVGHEPLQRRHRLAMLAQGELRLDLGDASGGPARDEVGDHGLIEPGGVDPVQRLAAPLRERPIQEAPSASRVAARGRLAGLGDRAVEAEDVDLLGIDREEVAGAPRLERAVRGREQLPELGDLHLEPRPRRGGGDLTPEGFDEGVGRDDPARLERQERQNRPALPAAQRKRVAISIDGDRAEQSHVEASRHTGSLAGSFPRSVSRLSRPRYGPFGPSFGTG